ncbi:MAG: S-layer homology domain-containing protein [Clostridia bacterium]|nr:S-layer homology domain-containing protein [Clostridia bacterium]
MWYTDGVEWAASHGIVLSYNDAFTWGDWAVPALQWACGTGVLEDIPVGMLCPTDDATRGEIAHAIHVFCEEVAK